MKFESTQVIPFPIEEVYRLVRDQLLELVPFLPNVKKIEIESIERNGDKVHVTNRWYGKGDIPKVAQKFVQQDKVAWLDTAVWDEEKKTCRWEITPMFFQEHVSCKGVNFYKEEGEGKTRLEITGELAVQAKGIKGVPRLLERKVSEQIEKFIVRLLTPNLANLAQGVTKYLDQQEK